MQQAQGAGHGASPSVPLDEQPLGRGSPGDFQPRRGIDPYEGGLRQASGALQPIARAGGEGLGESQQARRDQAGAGGEGSASGSREYGWRPPHYGWQPQPERVQQQPMPPYDLPRCDYWGGRYRPYEQARPGRAESAAGAMQPAGGQAAGGAQAAKLRRQGSS